MERLVRKSAAAILLQGKVGKRFEGIVTWVSVKGTWIRLVHPPAEGKVVTGSERMDVEDRVQVALVRTDVERRFVDLARANGR